MSETSGSTTFRFVGGFVLFGYLVALISAALAVGYWRDGVRWSVIVELSALGTVAAGVAWLQRVVVGDDHVHLCGVFGCRPLDRRSVVDVSVEPLVGGRFARNGVVTFHLADGRSVPAYSLTGGAVVGRGWDLLPQWLSWGQTVRNLRSAVLARPSSRDR